MVGNIKEKETHIIIEHDYNNSGRIVGNIEEGETQLQIWKIE